MARVRGGHEAPAESPVYLVDTPALARYLGGDLTPALAPIFDDAEKGRATLLLPERVLAEFVDSCSNGRMKVNHPEIVLEQVLKELEAAPVFTPTSMDSAAWQVFLHSEVKQPADRLLVALATARRAKAILTNSPGLKKDYPTLW